MLKIKTKTFGAICSTFTHPTARFIHQTRWTKLRGKNLVWFILSREKSWIPSSKTLSEMTHWQGCFISWEIEGEMKKSECSHLKQIKAEIEEERNKVARRRGKKWGE
jgi:hypothetical protein